MSSRPKISDETIEKIDDWIENHPEKGINARNKAIEYLVDKGIKADEEALTDQELTKRVRELEEKFNDYVS